MKLRSEARRTVNALRSALIAGAVLLPAPGQAEIDAVLYRVFLAGGATIVSYGEFARVADTVVLSMPVGGPSAAPALQLVTIPASEVDWPATERYAAAARASHYAATRGDADFAVMSAEVARALNDAALSDDPHHRLAMVEDARRVLTEWPRQHYHYRAGEVRQIAALVDEIVSELRVAAGARQFDLEFVAMAEPPPPVPLLPAPSLQERLEQALTAARLTRDPAERLALLRTTVGAIEEARADLPAAWAGAVHATASAEIAAELRIEQAYAALSRSELARAVQRAARADVRGVETVVRRIQARDAQLGRQRPQQVQALLEAVGARLDAARRLRLARDRWTRRAAAYRAYRRQLGGTVDRLQGAAPLLEDIRSLAGPDPDVLARLSARLAAARRIWARADAPAELQPVHAAFGSALQLAESACRLRLAAIESGRMSLAWDASSAAAGALMLWDRAHADLDRHLNPPGIR